MAEAFMTILKGGKSVFGAALGILMLEARFPRIIGDVGNAKTWSFPVHYKIVRDATPDRVVRQRSEGLLPAFIEAAEELVSMGADGITTNCGFLSLFQKELAAAVGVPIASSSLMQVNWVQALLPPGKQVGILTISKATLSEDHLRAAGVALSTPIGGTDNGTELTPAILGNRLELDTQAAEQDLVNASLSLVKEHPEIGALVLECTNMCPYSDAVSNAIQMPVFDMVSFINWFHQGLRPTRFDRSL